MTLVCWVGGLV